MNKIWTETNDFFKIFKEQMYEKLVDKWMYVRYIQYRTVVCNICSNNGGYEMSSAVGTVNGSNRTYSNYDIIEQSKLRSLNNRRRRERQLRRRIIIFVVMAAVIIFLGMFLSFSFFADAKSDDSHSQNLYYRSVMVTAGDTVWSIANDNLDTIHYRKTKTLVNDIAAINRISTDAKLTAGTYLVVPYYSEEIK